MTEYYQVGPDAWDDDDKEEIKEAKDFVWIAYHYEVGCYDGDGEAIGLHKDGSLYGGGLGHCSCYGPTESWPSTSVPVERLTSDEVDYEEYPQPLVDKVLELLGLAKPEPELKTFEVTVSLVRVVDAATEEDATEEALEDMVELLQKRDVSVEAEQLPCVT